MKKSSIITLVGVTSLLVGLAWLLISYFKPNDAQANLSATPTPSAPAITQASATTNLPSSAVSTTSIIPQNSATLSMDKRLALINSRNPNLHLTQAQLQTLMNKPMAWEANDNVINQLQDKLEPNEQKDGRKFISLDTTKIETLLPNDTLQVSIPQISATKQLNLKIDDISHQDGITSWSGQLTDFPDANTVTITQGGTGNTSITQIGFNTPQGVYLLEGFGNAGWIVSGGTKFNKGEIVIPVDENGVIQKPEIYEGSEGNGHNHSHE